MSKQEVASKIIEIGIVPVIRAKSNRLGMSAVEAVFAGGILVVEITMTVPGALDLIAQLSKSVGATVLIGAGTVLDAQTAQRCLDAGARFLVSPGLDLDTIRFANRSGTLIMAGALTPTEVLTAWKAGSDLVKIFPCGSVGSAKYLQALKAPLPDIAMVPTGGVNLTNAAEFIHAGAAALGVGSELVSATALESGNLSEITENARKYVAIVGEARRQLAAAGH
jgi:2-dehydro-3-deoxyphosphogluconate aldolase/(4S)-4-hydroxy-2-oxoglutarate aldolase